MTVKYDHAKYMRGWRRRNRVKHLKYMRAYRAKNKSAMRAYEAKSRTKHSNKIRKNKQSYYQLNKSRLVKRYRRNGLLKMLRDTGLSEKKYLELKRKQKNSCLLCKRKPRGACKRLDVDHCHSTGRFRGLLCRRCNLVIGHVNDDIVLLVKMAKYLKGNLS